MTSLAGLILELPYGNIYSDAEWSSVSFQELYCKPGECDPLAFSKFFKQPADVRNDEQTYDQEQR